MKHRPTKAELRESLQRDVEEFLTQGGEIAEVPRGATGWDNPLAAKPDFAFVGPRNERTPVQEVVAAIESRKSKPPKPTTRRQRQRPRKKAVYDDFGELIRWVWVD
ncbi:hypothetical protein [Motiliproteus sediminis]|uniref:hypothetical protein n=1 Tax=Motiliproteus sediminis TaxID=1468178 RepID=UPI001AEF655D|nr:hypothetical protein [Motiliproteus sediminis]